MGNLSIKWLAGFFDGEGCISFYKRKDKLGCYQLQIYLSNVDKNILMLVASIYSGTVKRQKDGVYVWRLCHRNLISQFLKDISKHLILKRPQAKMALIYLSTMGCRLPSKKISNIRENVYSEIKSEKRRFSAKNRIEALI